MKDMIRNLAGWLAGAALAYHGVAIAQDKPAGYPAKPIRLVVAVAPGAGADAIARGSPDVDRSLGPECRGGQPVRRWRRDRHGAGCQCGP